ncbi:transcriptional regulator, TetR family [Solidesulfovibrio fructosivorans JJ]]|uniref:Transcriptional regulator, TetR family n=1 Tax=Solidesulfovibrio fructosivorans JJ] TaxID=596151 RepID=E1JTQ9_SOLFR|nr:TetR/AcrR family transcriptional regulator [Solidesulfovibrio fructosivorans]EFL52188.1 transcriptional regulator, TetR family [Solidesulfovibrio fructosivorans JJ]]
MPAPNMREKILEAASRLFAFEGYSAVSMRRIATAVGMTQANLYYYFKDKEELIRSALAAVFNGRSHSLAAALASGESPEERLERAISWFVTLLFDDEVVSKLFFRELLTGDKDRLKFLTQNIFQESFNTIIEIIDACIDTPDPTLAAIYLASTIIGYCQYSTVAVYLQGAKPEYFEPVAVARHLMDQVRRFAKAPCLAKEVLA